MINDDMNLLIHYSENHPIPKTTAWNFGGFKGLTLSQHFSGTVVNTKYTNQLDDIEKSNTKEPFAFESGKCEDSLHLHMQYRQVKSMT